MIRRFPELALTLFVAASLGGAVSAASPQTPDRAPRIYVFSPEQVLAQTRDGKMAIESINARIKSHQATLEAKAAALRGIRQKLDSSADLMTEAAQAQLRAEFAKGETDLRRSQEDAEQDVSALRLRVLQPFEQRIASAMAAVAKERGADFIFQRQEPPLLFASDAFDLTSEIAKWIDATPPSPATGK